MTDRTEFIPLGGSVQRSDVNAVVEQIQNFVPIISAPSIGGKRQLRMAKRRGYQNNLVAPASGYVTSPESIFQWSGVAGTGTAPGTLRGVFVYTENKNATDLRLYKWNTSETLLGTFSSANYSCFAIQETLISGTPNLTLNIASTDSPYGQKLLVFPNGGALAEVTDGDFPATTIGPGVHMDGYYIVASTDGYLYWSDLNSVMAWTSGNRIAVQMEPDSLVGVAKVRNIIWALGTKTMEPFQMTGQTNPIMQRIAQATLRIGCASGMACSTGQELYFVGNASEGFGAYMLEGFAARKISNAFIDALLSADAGAFTILGNTVYRYDAVQGPVKHHGVTGILFNIILGPSNDIYIYYPSSETWAKFVVGVSVGAANKTFCSASGVNLASTGGGGNISWYDDNTSNSAVSTSGQDRISGTLTSFEASIQTAPLTHGTANMKFFHEARLIGDLQNVSTPVIYSTSDDNGATFVTRGTFDMSVNPIIPITRMGSARKRIHKLSNTSAGGCVIDGLQLRYSIGSN